jgi:uncharacterized protein (DUF924 family)
MNTPEQWQDDVLRFWFEELKPQSWFERDQQVDDTIRSRFSTLHDRLSKQPSIEAIHGAREALARVIVLDQFSRNLFRGSPRAFATDAQALRIAQHAIEHGWDQALSPTQRVFLYLPFEHAEDRSVQERSVELFAALGDPQALDYARRHKAVVDQFGRYPHRNAALGRASTIEEIEFMKTHPGF